MLIMAKTREKSRLGKYLGAGVGLAYAAGGQALGAYEALKNSTVNWLFSEPRPGSTRIIEGYDWANASTLDNIGMALSQPALAIDRCFEDPGTGAVALTLAVFTALGGVAGHYIQKAVRNHRNRGKTSLEANLL
jgi:hypothetical protein